GEGGPQVRAAAPTEILGVEIFAVISAQPIALIILQRHQRAASAPLRAQQLLRLTLADVCAKAVSQLGFRALEVATGDQVDNATDRVRAVNGRPAIGDDLQPLQYD